MGYLRPESAIRKLLRDSAGIQAVLPSEVTVCPLEDVPRNVAMPYITYKRMNASTAHHMGGVSNSGLWMGRTDITVFALTIDSAIAVADAIRAVLDGTEPETVTIGSDSVTFERMHLSDEDSDVYEPADASDSRVHLITQEYEWSAKP